MDKLNLQIIEINDEQASTKALVLDETQGVIYELTLFKQTYTNDKWVDDPDTMERYNAQLEQLGENFITGSYVDLFIDVKSGRAYVNEPLGFAKIDKERDGELVQVTIVEVRHQDTRVQLVTQAEDGERIPVNFSFGTYSQALKKSFLNPAKKVRTETRFKNLTGLSLDEADALLGKVVTVELKKNNMTAEGNCYADMKKIKR